MKWPVFHAAINSSLLELIPIDTLTIVGRRSSNLILSNIIIESWNKSSFWFLTRIIDNYKIIQDISSKYHGNTTNPPHFQNTTPFIFGIENTTSGNPVLKSNDQFSWKNNHTAYILSARRFTEDCKAVWAERRISSSNFVPTRFFQRQFLAGVGIGVGKTCTGVPFSPRRRCFSENSMRRRENYQRRRESRQRGILPPLALQRRREGHTHSGGRGAPTGVGREAGLFGQLGDLYHLGHFLLMKF